MTPILLNNAKLLKIVLLSVVLLTATMTHAQKTTWELGAGMGNINTPLYPGTDERKNYFLPYPYLKLETEYFKIDEGIQAFLFQTKDIKLDLTLDLGLPVSSKDSQLRTGMPELNTVIQLGPSLEITLHGSKQAASEFRVEFPLRTAIASDIKHTENIGWVFEPRVTYDKNRLDNNSWSGSITAGLRYATRDYHAYYYDVAPQYATAQRPVFYSDKGFNAWLIDSSATYRTKNMITWFFARYMNLEDSEYEFSPLVNDRNYLMIGAGITWIIAGNKYPEKDTH